MGPIFIEYQSNMQISILYKKEQGGIKKCKEFYLRDYRMRQLNLENLKKYFVSLASEEKNS